MLENLRARTALVVDDSDFWAENHAALLREYGYDVFVVNDGLSAAQKIRTSPPRLLVTDYFLANIDGGKLCRLAKQSRVEPPVTTIIVTSGLDRLSTQRMALDADVLIAKNRPEIVEQDLRSILDQLADPFAKLSNVESFVGADRLPPRSVVAKLHGLKRYLDALHEGIGDVVLCVDDVMRVFVLNTRASELLEIAEDDAIAHPMSRVLGIPEDHEVLQATRLALKSGSPRPTKPILCEVKGCTLRITVSALVGPSGQKTALVIGRDLSDLKSAEEERMALNARLHQNEKMIALGKLTAGIAHEINNPLGALLPNLVCLRDELNNLTRRDEVGESSFAEIMEIITDCTDAAERIRIVTSAMGQLGHPMSRQGEETRLEALLEATLSLVVPQLRAKARVIRELNPTPALTINRTELGQAFLNILLNAAHAVGETEGGDHWIRVRTEEREGGVMVTIANSGPPIPPEIRNRIFEPFFTTKEIGKGTGLGLSISYDLIRRHGGYIDLKTGPNSPVCFDIWIPEHTGMLKRHVPQPAHQGTTTAVRILVVDDEQLIRQSFRRVLGARHEVVLAENGARALEILVKDDTFDCVLCDLIMPVMSGMELYNEVHERLPELAKRFVFLTGGTHIPEGREFLRQVTNPRAYKPLDSEELLQLVEDSLHGKPQTV